MSLKKTGTAVLLMMASSLLFAETAKGAAEKAAAKDNLEQSIAWLKQTVPALETAAEIFCKVRKIQTGPAGDTGQCLVLKGSYTASF